MHWCSLIKCPNTLPKGLSDASEPLERSRKWTKYTHKLYTQLSYNIVCVTLGLGAYYGRDAREYTTASFFWSSTLHVNNALKETNVEAPTLSQQRYTGGKQLKAEMGFLIEKSSLETFAHAFDTVCIADQDYGRACTPVFIPGFTIYHSHSWLAVSHGGQYRTR